MKNYNNAFENLNFNIYSRKQQNEIFADYYDRLIYFLLPYCYYNMELTKGLVSESLTKVLGTKYNPEKSSFTTFVYNIAKNHVIDYFRLKKLQTTSENNFLNDKGENMLEGVSNYNPDSYIETKEKSIAFGAFLRSLNNIHRKMFLLYFLKGIDLNQLSNMVNKDYDYTRNTLGRLKSKFIMNFDN